jgi:UDP-N-acetylglucosamine diphosphorylase / glucose-1-phosphate thymidylyltransferase / UDP-N-acetylgalactosamine diphosphorylase / glucosamine-1-phosphate N-acetyltransferase / galactosamine-1-phosphate N-acetyltransferase
MNQHLYFFNLDAFIFQELFDNFEFPWQILPHIHSHLKKISLGHIEGTISPSAYLIHPHLISIGKGSIVEPGAYIHGPCHIGENCIIRHGAYIRGDFIAGNDCIIGHDTEVKNAIFLNGVRTGHFNYVADSIIGNEVNFGAGSKCANLRLDHQLISATFQEKKIATGLKKFGSIVGDHSQIGCNTVMNPGTVLGKGVFCHPCMNFGGFVPSHSVIKPNTIHTITPLCSKSSSKN